MHQPHSASATRDRAQLTWFLALFCLASLVHFVHNAEFLDDYPNLPEWLSRAQVYAVWFGVTAIGLAGYVLYRLGYRLVGLIVVAVYAAQGFDGLMHYGRAPFAAHTPAMNFSILFEVAAAAALLACAVILAAKHVAHGR
jgi:hypothetical protein